MPMPPPHDFLGLFEEDPIQSYHGLLCLATRGTESTRLDLKETIFGHLRNNKEKIEKCAETRARSCCFSLEP